MDVQVKAVAAAEFEVIDHATVTRSGYGSRGSASAGCSWACIKLPWECGWL